MYYIYMCPECLSHPIVPWDNNGNVLTCTIHVYYPEYLSHPVVPWDNMGILRNVLTCTTYTCVQSVCPILLYHGTIMGMY